MIVELLAIAAGVAAGSAVGALLRRRRRKNAAPKPAPPPPRREGDLRVGDAVLHLGDDFVVAAETRFEEEGLAFTVWTVESDDRIRFVLVDEGPKRKTEWHASIEAPVRGRPPERHRHADVEYRLSSRGRGKGSRSGAESPVPEGDVEWSRYAGPGRSAMVVLVSKGESLWLVGEETLPGMLEVLAAS